MAKAYGVYNNKGNVTACPAGSYCDGDFTARLCSNGTYSETEATRCTSCPPGQVASELGATKCETCAKGSYEVNRTNCLPCNGADYYCADGQQFECPKTTGLACLGGIITAVFGMYSESESVLQECNPGHYCPGDLQRHVCTNGTHAEKSNSITCNPCPKGSHQPAEGATTCLACPGGQYQDEVGSSDCKACEQGFFCTAGAPKKIPCPKGNSFIFEGLLDFPG